MEYAIVLAKNGQVKKSYEICEAMDDAVVWYHSREDKFLTHLCWAGKIPPSLFCSMLIWRCSVCLDCQR